MKKIKIGFIVSVFMLIFVSDSNAQGIIVSENSADNIDNSAMFEIKSTTKGLLIPRMTTAQRTAVSNPAEGLLIFDTDLGSFFIFGKNINGSSEWIDLSSDAGLWSASSSSVFLSNTLSNLGVGTNTPDGKFVVQADETQAPDDALFEVKNAAGETVFKVTSEGTRVYVSDDARGVSSGFAVGILGTARASEATHLLDVRPDSTRIYTKEAARGVSGGFAVGILGTARADNSNFMYLTKENYFIGHQAGVNTTPGTGFNGRYNLFLGYESALENTTGYLNTFVGHQTGKANISGHQNVFLGTGAGASNQYGNYNLFVGYGSGFNNIGDVNDEWSGSRNAFLGYEAGFNNTTGADNVMIGYNAGHENTTGGNNICLGTGAGKLNTNNSDNIFIGLQAGFNHTGTGIENTANNNIYIGRHAGYGAESGSSGENNVSIGTESGVGITSGFQNVFVGVESGKANTIGFRNVFIGDNAGVANQDGNLNTFVGTEAGNANVSADYNTFIGHRAGYGNTEGYNTIVGYNAGEAGALGTNQAFFGYNAGNNSTGEDNTYIGAEAGYYSGAGTKNVFVGTAAGREATGSGNVFIGQYSGYDATGNGNVFLGNNAGYTETNSNRLHIANSLTSSLIYGEFDNQIVRINGELQIGTEYALPKTDGQAGQVLRTDGAGNTGWTNGAPIAYGRISESASVSGGSGNYTVAWNSTENRYEITFDNFTYNPTYYSVSVTCESFSESKISTTSFLSSGELLVYVWEFDSATGVMQKDTDGNAFSFSVIKN